MRDKKEILRAVAGLLLIKESEGERKVSISPAQMAMKMADILFWAMEYPNNFQPVYEAFIEKQDEAGVDEDALVADMERVANEWIKDKKKGAEDHPDTFSA